MPKWIGNRFGSVVPINATTGAQSSVYSLFDQYYASRLDAWAGEGTGLTATGGAISDYTDGPAVYRAHIFTSSGTFDVTGLTNGDIPDTVEYLVVAGGGGAGRYRSGGGGAGGFRTNVPGVQNAAGSPLTGAAYPVSVTSYTVTVGGGGYCQPSSYNGTSGNNSVFGTITSTGGGYSAGAATGNAGSGGSGGGQDWSQYGTAGAGNTPPVSPPQGNPGGNSGASNSVAGQGGGGGAGEVGQNGTSPTGGAGGAGVSIDIETGVAKYYAGGGGGGADSGLTGGAGGTGGGGNATTPGTDNRGASGTGGGGGGAVYNPTDGGTSRGGQGGSGIVVVRYQIGTIQTGTAKASGGAISFYGSKTIHAFTNSGSFVAPASFSEVVEYLVVAGGGAGGGLSFRGGGGGAGAVRHATTTISSPQTIAVQVGGGGVSPNPGNPTPTSNGIGTPSFFGPPITASGGGTGGGYPGIGGSAGGSGGGGGAAGAAGAGSGDPFPGDPADSSPTNGWGYDGGVGAVDIQLGAGGGGAGGAGSPNNPALSPATPRGFGGSGIQIPATFRNPVSQPTGTGGGGLGVQSPTGTSWYIAGGGNGGGYSKPSGANPNVATFVPRGGGGLGAIDGPGNAPEPTHAQYSQGHPGAQNTGSGGGGASPAYDQKPGTGGSGLVLIAYPT